MLIDFKFSLFKAYLISFKTNYKHIFFYISWYLIVWLVTLVALLGLGIYTEIFNYSAMIQNYNWIISSFKHELVTFFIGYSYQDFKITEINFYGFLKLFVSENILNSAFSNMSLKEYFNVVFLPKKLIIAPFMIVYSSFVMTFSIGYIKTALKFQNDKKATLHDMYQYMYLLPQYFIGKIIIFLSLSFFMLFLGILSVLMFSALPLNQDIQKGIAVAGIIYAIIVVLMLALWTFVYQRLRFTKYFIIDKEVNAFQACKLSWNLTQGSVISLFLFSLVTVLVGIVHPMSGLFIMLAGWLNQQAEVSVYKQMLENKN